MGYYSWVPYFRKVPCGFGVSEFGDVALPGFGLRDLLEGAGDLVRVPKGLLKGIYRLPQSDLWGLGLRVYLKGQGT